MKPYRKLRRPGNRAPTKDEAARIVEAKLGPCIPCLVWALMGNMPLADVIVGVTYDHKKSGNIRRGHMFGFASCLWHHERVPHQGWTHARCTSHYGPSLMDGSRTYHATYGSDDYLIDLQTRVLSLPSIDESAKQELLAMLDAA